MDSILQSAVCCAACSQGSRDGVSSAMPKHAHTTFLRLFALLDGCCMISTSGNTPSRLQACDDHEGFVGNCIVVALSPSIVVLYQH